MGSMNNGRSMLTMGNEGLRRSLSVANTSPPQSPISSVAESRPPRSPLSSVADNSSPGPQIFNISRTPMVDHPAILFFPAHSSKEEFDRVVGTVNVALTGSAALGQGGLPMGSVDILESKDTYLFRVALPGVAQDNETFSWNIEPNGKLFIKGVTITGERTFYKHGMEFKRYTNNLCPPGDFSISFQLPGPVNPEGIQLGSGKDGVFEGIVKKAQP